MSREPSAHTLRGEHLRVGYGKRDIIDDLSVDIPAGRITVIVGANACGKSTLLRCFARLLKPRDGTVYLDDRDIRRIPSIDVARTLAMLPQTPLAPDAITVGDLVARGRYPRQNWLRRWSAEDDRAVARALEQTDTVDLVARPVQELSGGQRQRVWIAMALAQETDILLLDEPTSALDLAHQMDVLELLTELNARDGRTIVIVLHDLNQAARFAHHLIAMRQGEIVAQGRPADVITEEVVNRVFDLAVRVIEDPVTGSPMVIPVGRQDSSLICAPAAH